MHFVTIKLEPIEKAIHLEKEIKIYLKKRPF